MKQCIWILLGMLIVGCNGSIDNEGEWNTPTDLSDVLKTYEKNGRADDEYYGDDAYSVLCPFEDNDTTDSFEIEIYDEKPFTLSFPEYRDSKHPFLRNAEDIFNCCLIINGIWSNFEVWIRFGDVEDHSVAESIRRVNIDCLHDKELRQAAAAYREGMADVIIGGNDATSDENAPYDLRNSFIEKVNGKCYRFYEDPDELTARMNELRDSLFNAIDDAYQKYLNADQDTRLGLMLKSLNECVSFDAQCALLCKWADCKESVSEDMWIVAVATRLMDGKQYSPLLYMVWEIWRPLCQKMYFGASHDSEIPNKLYNDYRSRCFVTCLKYIAEHPDDTIAMNCASVLSGAINVNRYGTYIFGNQSVILEMEYMPKRFEGIFDGDGESADSISTSE